MDKNVVSNQLNLYLLL